MSIIRRNVFTSTSNRLTIHSPKIKGRRVRMGAGYNIGRNKANKIRQVEKRGDGQGAGNIKTD